MLRSDLFDYSNVYIAVKERITVKSNDGNIRVNKANTSQAMQKILISLCQYITCYNTVRRTCQNLLEDKNDKK